MSFSVNAFKKEIVNMGFTKFVDRDSDGSVWTSPGVHEYSVAHPNGEVILLAAVTRHEVTLSTRGASTDSKEKAVQGKLPQNLPMLTVHTTLGNSEQITKVVEHHKSLFFML